MKQIIRNFLNHKDRTIPILSFPSTQLLGITVKELISDSERQAQGMQIIAERYPVGASLNMMDLSVEAECFGAQIHFAEHEIPTVAKGVLDEIEDAAALAVPPVGTARTQIYLDGVKKAKERIQNVPVFCGVIGPYSLAGRLFDMTELMMCCYDSEEDVKTLLEKTTSFIIDYINAFRQAGADGVILAEPAAGLLSPELCEAFSNAYVKRIIEATSDDNFIFVYHNCGNTVPLAKGIAALGADAYHFGNAISLQEIIGFFPQDVPVMGNLDPVLFKTATPEKIRETANAILKACSQYSNFMLSSGCDIPADSDWKNMEAYFAAIAAFYGE